jgi:environmental stress-induced protein Ves
MSMGTQAHTAARVAARPVLQPGGRVVRGDTLKAAPWKNGGGVTREIAAYPVGASLETFVWRVSVADVERSGPFSQFPGIDRKLVLLAGAGMHLAQARGATHALMEPLAVASFDGEAALDAQLVDGATRDFNLMVRRDVAQGDLQVWRAAAQPGAARVLDGDVVLLYCASGAVTVALSAGSAQASRLHAGDTLRIDAPQALHGTLAGDGAVLAVSIRYTR